MGGWVGGEEESGARLKAWMGVTNSWAEWS